MLPRTSRMRSHEVELVMKSGRPLRGEFVGGRYLSVLNGTIRTAAVVPKAVAKRAVDRNKLRRALYKAIRTAKIGSTKKGYMAVLVLRKIPPTPLAPALLSEIKRLLSSLSTNH